MDSRRTLTSRACLRLLLGAYLACPATEITLAATLGGKPILGGPAMPDRIEFNVSHSDEWVLLGFSRGLPLGVDVERRRELEFDDLVKGFFSPREREQWTRLGPAQRPDAFFAAWTRKEAYLKALGVGLARSLDSFAVAFDAASAPALLWCADDALAPQRWRIVAVDLAPGYAAALAVDSSAESLQTFTFQYT
jgi:4'-phosphopantetheinyl transferase